MAITRNYQYDESKRPKLPRNVYDWIYTGNNESSSMFASSGGYTSVTTPVGAPMPEISVFTGATDETNGTSGLVPAPVVGEKLKFLQGTGAWIDIPAYRWLQEFPSNSTTKTGLQINGDFHVSKTLSTQTLRVEGSAHFWELVIDEASASGGTIFVSPALFEVDYVAEGLQYAVSSTQVQTILTQREDIAGAFDSNSVTYVHTTRAYMRCDDGDTRTANECVIGDMLRCKQFNIQSDVYQNVDNKDYWTFVVNTSDGAVNYTLSDGTVQKCFWVDLADYLVVNGGGRIPFNSTLNYEGGITIDPGQTTDIDLTDLKRQAQRTYNGTTNIDTEYGTLTDQIRSYVLSMYGISGGTRNLVSGNSASTQSTFSTFELNQIQSGLSQVANGTMDSSDDNLDATNMASLIIDETIADDAPSTSDLDSADSMTFAILGIPYDIQNPLTEEEASATTPSGMNRAPAYAASSTSTLEEWQFGYGIFALEVGDHLASFGHLFNPSRANAIVICASPVPIDSTLESPSISQYVGINNFGVELAKYRTTALANNGNEFTGSFLVDHDGTYMDVNERINLFINDITTGLTKVGIFLDGDNSTIRLVGSVDIKQHASGDYDSLSVYDSNDNKKVEISPRSIPAITDISTLIIPSNNLLSTVTYNQTFNGSSYVEKTDSGWWLNKSYKYTLRPITHTYTVTYNLGEFVYGDKLTIGSGLFTLNCPMTLNGNIGMTNRDAQSISSFMMRIYRVGSSTASWTVDLKNNYTMPSVNSENFTINIPSNMKSQVTISTAGSYYVEFSFAFTFGGYLNTSTNYDNPSVVLNTSFNGSFNSTIQRASANNNSFMQIGPNGLAFSMGNNKYMYASDSTMKFNWLGSSWSNVNSEGVGISFSDTAGMQIIRNVHTYSSTSNTLSLYDDVAIINCSGRSGVTINLPSAANYGKGRVLDIITINRSSSFGYSNITINSAVMKNHSISGTIIDQEGYQGGSFTTNYWDGTFKFISDGGSWYEI